MIRRNLDQIIENHYANSKSALLLTGARQTGKTFAIRNFARRTGMDLLEINFLSDPSASLIFKDHQGTADVLLRLSAYARKELLPGKTLIFFDEVQKCPEAVTMIKFLVDHGRFSYALSGSLLGVELKDLRSVPVGYMTVHEVFPLDLEELFLAVGVSPKVLDAVKDCFNQGIPVDKVVHEALMRLVNLYLMVGGMPAAVQAYLDTNDMTVVRGKQKEILDLYKWDIAQYDPEGKLYIGDIFDLIPSELDAKNKRFIMKDLREGSRFLKYENGFIWLENAGAAIPVYNVESPEFPLKLNEQRNLFKLFQNDVGLLSCQYAGDTALSILSGEVNLNFGAIYENMVAQELKAHGFSPRYFNSKKQGEVDFVVERGAAVIPIEVKSGKDYERHRAMNNILLDEDYNIDEGMVFYNGNMDESGAVRYFPIYMINFLRKEERPATQIYKPDLRGLK